MTISIWRYSHLALAVSSFVFVLIASVTGIILAFEPISNQLQPYAVQNASKISIAETIEALQKEYDEIVLVKMNEHNFLSASIIDKNGKAATFYIHPKTGKKLGNLIEKAPIYKFATNLHRSLFLKSTGRFLVSFFSFLLLLITITGIVLITKRQGGITKLFSKVVNENFEQYYHVIIGRYTFIPIIIITLTGVFLSLEKFSLLPKEKVNHIINFSTISSNKKVAITNFSVFRNTALSELKSIEFPFSEDEEDYFFLKLKNKELIIHQYSGDIISDKNLPLLTIVSNWSLFLHTGRGTIIWSIILMLSCFAILFFIYSGFIMAPRRKKINLPKNKYNKEEAEFIILVGSESGSTFSFAISLYDALITSKKSTFITPLNNYTSYKNAKHYIILTSTYGEGEPPTNAKKFTSLFEKITLQNTIQYSVVGFGSLAYPDYCKFAIEVNTTLSKHTNCLSVLPVYKINNQSFTDFKNWGLQWSRKTKIPLQLKQKVTAQKKQQLFIVIEKGELNHDDTFLILLKPDKKIRFTSGDLLSIIPKEDNIERLYSIGRINNNILLSIKKHEFGVCSNLLFNLKKGAYLNAKVLQNKKFHLPKKSSSVILVANGTGIAPFLGMLQQTNNTTTYLFWGGRTRKSLEIYTPYLKNLPSKHIYITYSKEKDKKYVQNLVALEGDLVIYTLKNKGTIMICGSIAMMNGVLSNLDKITSTELKTSLTELKKAKRIKTDCY